MFCVTLLGKASEKLALGFLQTSPHMPFLFAYFDLHHFAIINGTSY